MQIVKALMVAGLVSALLLTSASAKGGIITTVTDDSGGGSLMTVTGTTGGGTVVGNSSNIETFEVNGVTGLSIPTSYAITITDGTLSGGVLPITASGTATFGTGGTGSEAVLAFTATGSAFTDTLIVGGSPLMYSYIVLSGTINSVPYDNYSGYSFSPSMVNAAISLSIDKTGTDYTQVLGNNGVMVRNSGISYQQDDGAVPEPASMTLLGIGLSSLLAFRRFRSGKG